ncbi:MAG: site-specific DNA-methyltransferase, partial [Methanoculleus thermophilus]
MRRKGIPNRNEKGKVRQGTGNARHTVQTPEPPAIRQFTNSVICGDAMAVLPAIPDRSIDLIITSPPYNFGHHYANDSM